MLTFKPLPGSYIGEACETAVKMAIKKRDTVEFEFNGVTLVVTDQDTPNEVVNRWHAESDRQSEEYRKSPQHLAYLERRKIEVCESQRIVDNLIISATKLTTDDEWMEFASQLAKHADDVDVQWNPKQLIGILESRGFTKNELVTDDPDEQKRLRENSKMMARYIMGQVISCLDRGMAPHQVTIGFVEQYKDLRSQGK